MLLAIDTATHFAGLALWGDDQVWADETWYSAMTHSVELMPRIRRMLHTHRVTVESLTGVAVSLGPGSFTGLRIGLAAAKGLVLPFHLPIIGVPTLDAIAYPYRQSSQPVWAILQAGRGRIGVACYTGMEGMWTQLVPPSLTTLDGLCQVATLPATFVGELDRSSAGGLRERLGAAATITSPCLRIGRMACMAELAARRLAANDVDDVATLAPLYLQSPEGTA
jgi:tRNA threonylcarbamoyladenosine biosynthesis protein TsaB